MTITPDETVHSPEPEPVGAVPGDSADFTVVVHEDLALDDLVADTSTLGGAPIDVDAISRTQRQARRVRSGQSRRSAISILLSADLAAVGGALVLGQLLDAVTRNRAVSAPTVLGTVCYIPIFIGLMATYGLYHRAQRRLTGSSFPDLSRLIHSLAASALLALFASGAVHRWLRGPSIDRTTAALAGVVALVFVLSFRAAAHGLFRRPEAKQSNILVVGRGQVAEMVVARLSKLHETTVVGCVDDGLSFDGHGLSDIPWLGSLEDIPQVIETWNIDHLIVAFSSANEAGMAAQLRSVPSHVRISVVPRMFDLLTVRSSVDDLRGLPVIDVAPASLGLTDRVIKRLLDIVVSGTGLVLLSPLLIVVALAVKLSSPGPILFSQMRTGRNRDLFRIHKFRTMYVDADRMKAEMASEVDGPLFKVKRDPRITTVGRILRKTSLDELPQLINVFVGDMSLVGPRPFVPNETAEIEGWAAKRFDVRPGMTGLWQVSGRNDLPFGELCRLDYVYVASWSLWWDLSILWRTPGRVLRQDGAY